MSTIDSRQKRSGYIAVLTAVMMIVLLGFAAIAVDYASIVSKEQQLRRAVDHTALAAIEMMRQSAIEFGPTNLGQIYSHTMNYGLDFMSSTQGIDGTSIEPLYCFPLRVDMADGRISGPSANQEGLGNAVYVVAGLGDFLGLGPGWTYQGKNPEVPAIFGRVFDYQGYTLIASTVAAFRPMDIMIVYDLSTSMNWDSLLYHIPRMRYWRQPEISDTTFGYGPYPDATINLQEVWDSFDGVDDEPVDRGPTFGYFMESFADPATGGYGHSDEYLGDLSNYPYDKRTDPGLIYLPGGLWWKSMFGIPAGSGPNGTINTLRIQSLLFAQGYNQYEIDSIMTQDFEWNDANGDGYMGMREVTWYGMSATKEPRKGITLGLFTWNSGLPADGMGRLPRWQRESLQGTGNGDFVIEANELNKNYVPAPPYLTRWDDYLDSAHHALGYIPSPGKQWYYGDLFGVKTLVSHVINYARNLGSPPQELVNAPLQPHESVQTALATVLGELSASDRVGLVKYSGNGDVALDLQAAPFHAISAELDATFPGSSAEVRGKTNIGEALRMAIDYLLTGTPSPGNGMVPDPGNAKAIFLLTDGLPESDGLAGQHRYVEGFDYALQQAERARYENNGIADIKIHTATIGAQRRWNVSCEDPAYMAQDDNYRKMYAYWFNGVRYGTYDGCGAGQSIAYITGGRAARVVGDFASVEDRLAEQLRIFAWDRQGLPMLVDGHMIGLPY